jgi:hypothetical protein
MSFACAMRGGRRGRMEEERKYLKTKKSTLVCKQYRRTECSMHVLTPEKGRVRSIAS